MSNLQSESARILKDSVSIRDVCELNGIRFRNGYAPCPVHNEKTASMSINPKTGKLHCFGCGWTGDMFDLMQKLYALDTPSAMKRIATDFGIRIPLMAELTAQEKKDIERKQAAIAQAKARKEARLKLAQDDYSDAIAEFAYFDRVLDMWGECPEFQMVMIKRELASRRIDKCEERLNKIQGGEDVG